MVKMSSLSNFLFVNDKIILSFIFVTATFNFGISQPPVLKNPFILHTEVDQSTFRGKLTRIFNQ